MPKRKENFICDTCRDPACGGGCYYTPRRVVQKLGQLPSLAQTVTNPNSYGRSSQRVEANPMEGNWAVRADLTAALDHAASAVPDGPSIRQVLVLAYVGIPEPGRAGKYVGCSDAEIGRLLGMDRATVASFRRRGVRLMVEKLNPDYKFEEES